MKSIFVIANREISSKIKSKAFIISTVVCMVIISLIVVAAGIIMNSKETNVLDSFISPTLANLQDVTNSAKEEVLKSLGTTPELFDNKVSQKTSEIIAQNPELSSNLQDTGISFGLGYIVGIVMYMMIVISSGVLAQSVAEEKASSIAEIILSSTTPFKLLSGKILGIATVCLTQVSLITLSGVIPASIFNMIDLGALASMNIGGIFIYSLLFFVVGYLSYSSLLAAFASRIKRIQDVQSAIMPIMMIAIVGYVVAITGGGSGIVALLSNYCPLLSPYGAPASYARGDLNLFQAIISLGISTLFLPIIIWFAARLYRNSILDTGTSKLRQIFSFGKN